MSGYKNPIPHLGGKRFVLHMAFDFADWIEDDEAAESIKEWIAKNGIPASALENVTPTIEYRR